MSHVLPRWNALVVILALATMLGCQGLSTSKSNSLGTQNPGALSSAPSSISFGNVQNGTTQTQSDTLTNTGTTSLTIAQADVSGTGFSIGGLSMPMTLAAGQSTSFTVIFAPQSPGSASGTLTFTNSDTSTLIIPLSGMGVAIGSLSGSPTSFSFGNLKLDTKLTQTETLTNTGGENLIVSQASVTGTGFSYSGLSLPMTLVPNQSTTFGVAFAPTSVGASNGILSITVSGSSTTLDIALSGAGVLPATLTATPASLTFTSVQVGQNQEQTETVKNTGGMNATISQASVSGKGFSISGISTPVTLTPGQSASFTVTFSPESAGNASGSVAIASDASNPNLSIALSGSAITQSQGTLAASSVNVGSVTVGTSGTQTGTLTASGASVTVSSVSLSGTNASEFSISGLSFPVTVTTSQPVTFKVKFTPGASGAASATASFASDASNTPSSASLTGTGTAAATHTVTLNWTASTTSGITSYNVYRITTSGTCGTTIPGGTPVFGSTAGTVTTFTDTTVVNGTTYCYATTAVDANGESGYSDVTQAKIPTS